MFDEWACGFFLGSVAEWVVAFGTVGAAIGTVLAVYTAVMMSRSDRDHRKGEAHERAMSAAALMRSDLLYLKSCVLRITNTVVSDVDAINSAQGIQKFVVDHVDHTLMDRHGDRLSRLPSTLVVPVSNAVGSVKMLGNYIQAFELAVRLSQGPDRNTENVALRDEALATLRGHLRSMEAGLGLFDRFNDQHLVEVLAESHRA